MVSYVWRIQRNQPRRWNSSNSNNPNQIRDGGGGGLRRKREPPSPLRNARRVIEVSGMRKRQKQNEPQELPHAQGAHKARPGGGKKQNK